MEKVEIICEELVSLPVGNGITQNIIFNPAQGTRQAIRKKVDAGFNITDGDGYYYLAVRDNGGEFTSIRPHRFHACRMVRNIIILTTMEW